MKIRIKGDTIRYRLSKTDVSNFKNEGYIEESTDFGHSKFGYALKKTDKNTLSAIFIDNKITILMPAAMAAEWTSTDRIGFEGYDDKLFMLIEKDFQCLDNVAEDQSDNYPNPNGC